MRVVAGPIFPQRCFAIRVHDSPIFGVHLDVAFGEKMFIERRAASAIPNRMSLRSWYAAAQSDETIGHCVCGSVCRKTFDFRRGPDRILAALATPPPDSGKRHGNPAWRTGYRKTDEFPVPERASLIGRLMVRVEKRMS